MTEQITWSRIPDEFVVVDIETTGLNPVLDEILEIGAIRFTKEKYFSTGKIDTFQVFVAQTKHIPEKITRINSISDEMVKDGSSLRDALTGFFEFAGHSKLVAFNAPFEEDFIEIASERVQLQIPRRLDIECVLDMARDKISNVRSYKLRSLAKAFNVDTGGAHRAIRDCVMTMQVYINLLNTKTRLEYIGKGSVSRAYQRSKTDQGGGLLEEGGHLLGFLFGKLMRLTRNR